MTSITGWCVIIDSVWDWDGEKHQRLPGVHSLVEILELIQCPYNEVDRIYQDFEILGGE